MVRAGSLKIVGQEYVCVAGLGIEEADAPELFGVLLF